MSHLIVLGDRLFRSTLQLVVLLLYAHCVHGSAAVRLCPSFSVSEDGHRQLRLKVRKAQVLMPIPREPHVVSGCIPDAVETDGQHYFVILGRSTCLTAESTGSGLL